MNDDGHYIDDPLMVVNAKPDFSGLGMQPIHPNGMPITLAYLIGDIPYWVKFLPKDWEGETIRAVVTFAVSKLAIENAKFDLKGFVSEKFVLGLRVIKNKHRKDELYLSRNYNATIDDFRDKEKTYFYFHVEFAK